MIDKIEDTINKILAESNIPFVEEVNEGCYKIGDLYTGRKGLEEFDRVMTEKAKEYGK